LLNNTNKEIKHNPNKKQNKKQKQTKSKKMKNLKKTLAAVVVLVAMSSAAKAQTGVTNGAGTEATAHAQIVTPITIVKDADLEFGILAVTATPGDVVIDPSDPTNRTPGGGVSFSTANPGTVNAAKFTVSGTAGYSYEITNLTTSIIIDNEDWLVANPTGTLDNMVVSGINSWIPASGTSGHATDGVLGGLTGEDVIYVGGKLEVKGDQEPGVYTTSATNDALIEIAVNYN
jgi:hypothetical protein